MKYILILIAVLFSTSAFAVNLADVEAVLKSCQSGTSCSCPRARINFVDLEKSCGKNPTIQLDQNANWSNKKEFDAWGECAKEVEAANDKIRRYNSIFDHCQHPFAKNENVNRPLLNKPDYSKAAGPSSDKSLAEQVAEAKERDPDDVDRKVAAEEARQRAAEQASQSQLPIASAPEPNTRQQSGIILVVNPPPALGPHDTIGGGILSEYPPPLSGPFEAFSVPYLNQHPEFRGHCLRVIRNMDQTEEWGCDFYAIHPGGR
ncbi:MAG: hypothetical protein ABSG88_22780 [Bradyrhizobium sp.]|jgi:hypothetical protein